MEASTQTGRGPGAAAQPARPRGAWRGCPVWVLAVVPLALIAVAIAAFALLGGPGTGRAPGPSLSQELAVERTVLTPGEIELTVRNTGPDAVEVAQVAVADAYVAFEGRAGG